MKRIVFTLAVGLLAGAAQAAPARDAATGLAVDPPAGYAARAETPDQQHAARFSVRKESDTDGGCQLAFSPAAANTRLSQPEINARMGSTVWQDAARTALAPVYDVLDTRLLNLGEVLGLELQADFKPRRELPARAGQLRSYFVILETPRGRTTLVCVADRTEFPARIIEFAEIARRTAPP